MLNLMDNPEIKTPSVFKRLRTYLSSATYARTIGFIGLLIVIAAIPLTVFIAQKQQETRQRASTSCPVGTYNGTRGTYTYSCKSSCASGEVSSSVLTCASGICCYKEITTSTTNSTTSTTKQVVNCPVGTYNGTRGTYTYSCKTSCDTANGEVTGSSLTCASGVCCYKEGTTTTTSAGTTYTCSASSLPGGLGNNYDVQCSASSTCASGWNNASNLISNIKTNCGSNACCYRLKPVTSSTTSSTWPPTTTTLASTTTTTPPAGSTILALTLGLDGIGSTGDNLNPSSVDSNKNPLHTTRNVSVKIYDKAGAEKVNGTGSTAYNATTGKFAGSVTLASFTTGDYIVKVKTDGFLRRLIAGIQTIRAGTTNTMPLTTLINGDIDNDNKLTIFDYNLLINCSSFKKDKISTNTPACSASIKIHADLDDNGIVNQYDYQLFIREFSAQAGD